MAYYCYIVQCANGNYYTGWSTDPLRRLRQHNAGKGAQYTRANSPCQLLYVEEVPDHSAALRREIKIKLLRHNQKTALIADLSRNILPALLHRSDAEHPED
ncbi:MAG: GIY-YIG nuclease family protein [Anaerolineaceae bacterium]|nr:GIY-YIG nuclease family protein [Anaerolineaceae bacterium]